MSKTSPAINLETSIRYLKGVGPQRQIQLNKLGIATLLDLIYFFPNQYRDFSQTVAIKQVEDKQTVSLRGKIGPIRTQYLGRRKNIQRSQLTDASGKINVIWFNQPYLTTSLPPGTPVSLSGKISFKNNCFQIVAPSYEPILGGRSVLHTGRLVADYSLTAGVNSKYIRNLIYRSLPLVNDQVKDFLPESVIKNEKLIPLPQALNWIHFPPDQKKQDLAKNRLAFDEAFLLECQLVMDKKLHQNRQLAPILKNPPKIVDEFIKSLPFRLTTAQKRSLNEIVKDLGKKSAMNRLLEGDVGSGKTVVAAAATLLTIKNNYQVALMAPTEILAQQHYQTFKKLFAGRRIKIALLTGSQKTFPQGSQLIIGTHALIHHQDSFRQIGLVIIDEQHRFGVAQRAKLIKKASIADRDKLSPHVLTMTATPIPRTVALTVYGNLDISTLDQMPPGRKTVKTHYVPTNKRQACHQWIKKQIDQEQAQVFIIYPLIDESESLESIKAATVEYQQLKEKVFPTLKVELLHGRMKSKDKEKILNRMQKGKIDILVATPVVEVGIDIPGATIMIIESANRFGLAQLHQLRGRIGRNQKQSYCFLFAETKSNQSAKRLKAMEQNSQGRQLAEIDLKIRGPGEIYGTRQHGFDNWKLLSLGDLDLIQKARKQAEKVIGQDPKLKQLPQLKKQLLNQKRISLVVDN
ncbi:MAG: ATP-dependent DNA helicase RecG [Patescibacteria group bacterium]